MRVPRHAEIIITRTQLEARTTERDTSGREREARQKESRREPSTEGGSEARVNVIMENISRARDTSGETRGKQSVY